MNIEIISGVSVQAYIWLSLILFAIGVFGVLSRKNAIVIFMSVELMLNAANLLLVAFSKMYADTSAQVFVMFTMAVAAAEVAVGLAILVLMYRNTKTVNIDVLSKIKG
ncbi:MAG: NADH-quinone oxidoreductase subunit NuoK [Chitinophagales bacterium]|nr:NADH-quinone oxidoreductase subunit NuoK [Chitinophagales bacterium]